MKKIIKKLLIIIAFTPVALIILAIIPFLIAPIINEVTLNGFAKQLYNSSLPANTKLIEKEAVCGKLNGNGNGMDFFACILIQSEMSLEELADYYQNMQMKAAQKTKGHLIIPKVVPADGYQLKTDYLEHADIYFDKLKGINDYAGYYVVMIYDGGYFGNFDIRAH